MHTDRSIHTELFFDLRARRNLIPTQKKPPNNPASGGCKPTGSSVFLSASNRSAENLSQLSGAKRNRGGPVDGSRPRIAFIAAPSRGSAASSQLESPLGAR
jgi:hypothetical protein